LVEYGELLARTYLPANLLPSNFETISFDDLYALIAKANCAREMKVEDFKSAVAQVMSEMNSD